MAKKLDQKEIVSFEELLMSNVIEQEALVNLLEKKGMVTKAELLEEIKKIKNKRALRKLEIMPTVQELRVRYQPTNIKYLLLAESPPESQPHEFRFFYNPENENKDYFFRSVMQVIFPDFKALYRKGDKGKLLERFKEEGFFMIDAVDTPINNMPEKERNQQIASEINARVAEIQKLISKQTPIFLIKKNIFNIFHPVLKEMGFNVCHDERLPFPSTGQQERFKHKFKELLGKLGFEPKARKGEP